MADLHAHIGRGGFERARIMPPNDLLLERLIPPEDARLSTTKLVSRGTLLRVNAATGNDTNTKAQVIAGSAWATIGRAVWGSTSRSTPNTSEAAAAGDTVLIASGTYSTNEVVTDAWTPTYNPANDGTAANPIRFQADGTVTLAAPSTQSPVIGANAKDYIEWYADISQGHSFQILADPSASNPTPAGTVNVAPDTGPVTFAGTVGGLLEGVVINGGGTAWNDNYKGVGINGCDGVTVRNCTIHSFHNANNDANSAGVQFYGATNCIVEHNYIYDVQSAVSFKDTGSSMTYANVRVRFNLCDDIGINGVLSSFLQAHTSVYVYQNVFKSAVVAWNNTRADAANNVYIVNNVFYNLGAGAGAFNGGQAGGGSKVWNNIVHTAPWMIYSEGSGGPTAAQVDFEHNVFYNATSGFYSCTDGTKTIAQWRTAYTGQDADSPQSVTTDPLFVSLTAGSENFHLQGGSPAAGLGVDLLDLDNDSSTIDAIDAGCYVTGSEVIGLES